MADGATGVSPASAPGTTPPLPRPRVSAAAAGSTAAPSRRSRSRRLAVLGKTAESTSCADASTTPSALGTQMKGLCVASRPYSVQHAPLSHDASESGKMMADESRCEITL
eukprot:CAMPEP_0119431982 /NCGR_PEP_ID=MMETSP1335-20130426/46967_1 /TAXON_ID=259385 /ORGANISM="Chrysoculter rhomboideus, Strain RCC1486" /LENGTH=109 /DNA_ID=CAMNT_0007457793 /DNA_START=94 /DNA_END=423 /DNA_ORIENTATION=-